MKPKLNWSFHLRLNAPNELGAIKLIIAPKYSELFRIGTDIIRAHTLLLRSFRKLTPLL